MAVIPRTAQGISNDQLPEIFDATDQAARNYQGSYFTRLQAELICLVAASTLWAILQPWGSSIADLIGLHVGDVDIKGWVLPTSQLRGSIAAGVVPAFLTLVVFILMAVRLLRRPDERWRRYRALAEGVVGLAWRYGLRAQAGELPFADPSLPIGVDAFVRAYDQLLEEATGLDLPPTRPSAEQITQRMDELRSMVDLDHLRTIYVEGRVEDQRSYYARRAKDYQNRRVVFRAWILVTVGLAALTVPVHGLGIFTMISTALGTWLGARQYEDLGPSYAKLDRQLSLRSMQGRTLDLVSPGADKRLALYVNDVEILLEGEHRLWLARSTRATA